jgi:Zn-dependent protease with chaperone function
MARLAASYFDGKTARRHAATLDFAAGTWVVEGDFGRRTGSAREVDVGEPMGDAPRRLCWADGACCEVEDGAAFAALLALSGQGDSSVLRMQQRWPWAVAALVGVAAALALLYFSVLPWAAARIAPAIPPAVTAALSRQVLETLDAHVLKPSQLAPARQQALTARLAGFAGAQTAMPAYRLHFRTADGLGANAFALPSGDIVVLDKLVAMADGDDQVLAVLAHELGHVAHRHGMRQLLQSAVVGFVAGVYLGDVSSLAASLGALVLESRYSRAFEFEADRYGADLLRAGGLSPELLATMLERLERAHDAAHAGNSGKAADQTAEHGSRDSSPFATHPDTAARLEALRRSR